jgi:hypothetical protein
MYKQLARWMVILLIFLPGIVSAKTPSEEMNQTQPDLAKTTIEEKTGKPEKALESINGAFGIQLGEHFEPSMVTKVLSDKQQTYRAGEGEEHSGKIFQVEPGKPDERFQEYFIKTTSNGLIYAIQGNYQYETNPAMGKKLGKVKHARTVRKTCKAAVKSLAMELEARYGKPRGTGWNGEWYSFRQLSDTSEKSLRLYANRCRTGLYSLIYTDEKVKKGTAAKEPKLFEK